MQDEMRKIIDSIVPPTPVFGENEDEDADEGGEACAAPATAARGGGAGEDGGAAEITEAALDEAERDIQPEDERDDAENLGVFYERDYAERIAGWEFKTEAVYVATVGGHDTELEVFYRRPLGSPSGVKWERIGHERSADALDLRRLMRCAALRDERAARESERQRLIESLFGAGSLPLLASLVAAREAEAAPALTPRQEAFCRHYLTEPSGARAAIMAGYSGRGADVQASRLLGNVRVLQKISALRRAHALSYTLDRDTMLDKLEAFFADAMEGKSYSAALRALLAQAEIGGLLNRRHKATERAEARARADVAASGQVGK